MKEDNITETEKKIKRKKKNKQRRRDWMKGILLIMLLFLISGVALYCYGYSKRNSGEPTNVSVEYDSIDRYDYIIYKNATSYYKDEFKKLKDLEETEDIAKQVAKLFVIDLFSINYKINKYEVTSAQYFYSDKRDMHRQKVIDNLYNLVEDDSYDDRKQKLPEVSNVEIVDYEETTYKLGDKEEEWAAKVILTIDYKVDMGYDKKAEIILVKDGKYNISVVSYKKL